MGSLTALDHTVTKHKTTSKVEYLIRFLGYGPEHDVWQGNVSDCPEVVKKYWDTKTVDESLSIAICLDASSGPGEGRDLLGPNAGVLTSDLPDLPGQVSAALLLSSASPAACLPASQKELCREGAEELARKPCCLPAYLTALVCNAGLLACCCYDSIAFLL